MRISDWSSDVCSSDLSEGRVSESIAALYDKAACVPYILSAIEDQHLTEFSVEARGLTKYFEGFAAADHVTLEVPAGSIYGVLGRSEEHTSELQSLMRISYAVLCLKQKKRQTQKIYTYTLV